MKYITEFMLTPFKLLANIPCYSTFVPVFSHLENSSDSCITYCPRISISCFICSLSFKTPFKSHLLWGTSFDHYSWEKTLPFFELPEDHIWLLSHSTLYYSDVCCSSDTRVISLGLDLFHFMLFIRCFA